MSILRMNFIKKYKEEIDKKNDVQIVHRFLLIVTQIIILLQLLSYDIAFEHQDGDNKFCPVQIPE